MILDHGYWAGLTLYPQTKVSRAARRRHRRALRPGPHLRRRRLRLGPERLDGRAAVHHGDAPAQAFRGAHPSARVREPGAVPQPVAERSRSGAERSKRDSRRIDAERTQTVASSTARVLPPHVLHQHPRGRRLGGGVRQPAAVRAGAEGAALAGGAVRRRPAALGARSARAARGRAARASFARSSIARASTSRSSTASRTAPSTARRSRPTSTRRTGAIDGAGRLHARPDRDPGPACCRTASTAASRPRRCRTSRGWPARTRAPGDRSRSNVVRVAEALVRLRQSTRHAHPSRHRARAGLLAREHRRDRSSSSSAGCCRSARRRSRRRSASAAPTRERYLRDHVRLCFDCCHFAVEYEDPEAALERLRARRHPDRPRAAQLGADVRRFPPTRAPAGAAIADAPAAVRRLRPTCTRSSSARRRRAPHYPDLDVALERLGAEFPRPSGAFTSTCRSSRASTRRSARRRTTSGRCSTCARGRASRTHLEIETYTWDVLPPGLKIDLLDSIGREYDWVLGLDRTS